MNRTDILRRLQKRGWIATKRSGRSLQLPPELVAQHPKLPETLSKFVGGLSSCVNQAQTAWFLCEADYAGKSGAAFRWDEWERMSLIAAGKDRRLANAVRAFWKEHFPFLLSVGDGYAYFAIRTADDGFGQVVSGREPEFEEADLVADSFEEFLAMLVDGKIQA